jgi:pyrimidine-nucleoside phosphorylase
MLSGRGLGHTGGTLDKLESIAGFQTNLSESHLRNQLKNVGCFISAQTESIAPADKLFYALRNETATVPCIPLIVASILSKKLAEGIDSLVMDVKWGKGAFMKTLSDAQILSRSLESVGSKAGLKMRCLHTQTDAPLGKAVGNALEVEEAIQCLQGEGPKEVHDLVCSLIGDPRASSVLSTGAAYDIFEKMVHAQGGSLSKNLLGGGCSEFVVQANKAGTLIMCDAYLVGMSVVRLGGGRVRAQDPIDPGVGIWVEKKIGETVEVGDVLFRVKHRNNGLEEARTLLNRAVLIGNELP